MQEFRRPRSRLEAGVCRCRNHADLHRRGDPHPIRGGKFWSISRPRGSYASAFDALNRAPRISAAGFSARFQHRPSSLHTMREGVATSSLGKGEFISIAKAPDASAQPSAVVSIASLVFMESFSRTIEEKCSVAKQFAAGFVLGADKRVLRSAHEVWPLMCCTSVLTELRRGGNFGARIGHDFGLRLANLDKEWS